MEDDEFGSTISENVRDIQIKGAVETLYNNLCKVYENSLRYGAEVYGIDNKEHNIMRGLYERLSNSMRKAEPNESYHTPSDKIKNITSAFTALNGILTRRSTSASYLEKLGTIFKGYKEGSKNNDGSYLNDPKVIEYCAGLEQDILEAVSK